MSMQPTRDPLDEPTTFRVGDVTCQVLSDGEFPYPPDFLFSNVDPEVLAPAVAPRLDGDGTFSTPYRCLLLETDGAKVLIDTGLGRAAALAGAPAGRLLDSLSRAGLGPGAVDVVVLSHAHPDHLGGLLDDGALTFASARHVMSRTEWEFWSSEATLARLPDELAAPARETLPPLARASVLELVDGEDEVAPGVRLIPAPGHTPGHCAVMIGSGASSAIFLADAVLDELQLAHLDWVSVVDYDPDQTVTTRRRLLDTAASENSHLLAYHMHTTGRIERGSGGYRFVGGEVRPASVESAQENP